MAVEMNELGMILAHVDRLWSLLDRPGVNPGRFGGFSYLQRAPPPVPDLFPLNGRNGLEIPTIGAGQSEDLLY